MSLLIYKIIFLFISLYIGLKTIGYGLYEIEQKENKNGGITVIVFSCLSILFCDFAIFLCSP